MAADHGTPSASVRPGLWWLVATGTLLVALAASWLSGAAPQPSQRADAVLGANLLRSELVNRLRLADRVLRSIAADKAARGQRAAQLGATEQRYFESVSYFKTGESPVPLLGPAVTLPALGLALSDRLANGESVIVAVAQSARRPAQVVMLRSLVGRANGDALLVGEIAPQYLWEIDRKGLPGVEFCVRDETAATLHCSSPRVMQALGALGKEQGLQSGPVHWHSGAESWGGASVALDLTAPATNGDWRLLALTALDSNGIGPGPGLGVVLAGVTALAALAGFVVLRRRRGAAQTAESGLPTGQSANALDPSGASAQRMLQKLARQERVIQAMADIDRASLSRADAPHLVALAAGHLLACSDCDVLLIGVLDRDITSSISVVVASRDGGPTAAEHKEVGTAAAQLLSLPPDGTWVRQVRDFALLEAQAQAGVEGALLLPIYEDGKPIGIISVGFTSARQMGADESGNMRALAGRLGAALTSAARAQALYAYTHFDSTTSLPNRQYLKEHLAQQIRQARRDGARLALLFVDLDGFKKVNASLGHSRADLVLAEAAARMRSCVREVDVVTRFGGDEFVIVLPRISEGVHARRVADKLLASVGQPYVVGGEEQHLGCSIGISIFPDDAQTVEQMLRNADSAMFNAKEAGRGRFLFFDETVNRAAAARTELERDLRRALANGEFSVAYQPQIDLRSGRIDAVEALVRWRHPTRGMVPPVEFIAVAEGAGLIAQIGEFVMRTACAQFSAWVAEKIAPRHLAVNVSGLEIVRTDIVARVESVLRETGLRPMHLELELTEGVFLDHTAASLEKLHQLQQRGVSIAIDDFGTGYSSLSYLQRLPIDVIKIDQSFVRRLGSTDDGGSIVRAILEVARGLGKSVVAEGIETEQQRALLAGWGCDVGQGYLWSPPLGPVELAQLCRAWQASHPLHPQPE